MTWQLSPMNNSEKSSVDNTKKVPEVAIEELTECPECDSAQGRHWGLESSPNGVSSISLPLDKVI